MLSKKTIFILILFLISVMAIGAVSAGEVNGTDPQTSPIENDTVSMDESSDEAYSSSSSEISYDSTTLKFSNTGDYYGQTKLHIELVNSTSKKRIGGESIGIYIGDSHWKDVNTNPKGAIDLDFNKMPGKYSVTAKLNDNPSISAKLNFEISKIPTSFEIEQKSAYYRDCKITFKLTNVITNRAMANEKIALKFSNGKSVTVKTNSKGIATYDVPFKPGTYSLTAKSGSKIVGKNTNKLNNFEIGKTYLKITPSKLTTTYKTGKNFKVKVTNYFNKHKMSKVKLKLKVYTGKKYKTYIVKTNSKGIASFDTSKLKVGTHKVIVENAQKHMDADSETSYITISK